jgi:hypothetical protein
VVVVATQIPLFALRFWAVRHAKQMALFRTARAVYCAVGAMLVSALARLAVPALAVGV